MCAYSDNSMKMISYSEDDSFIDIKSNIIKKKKEKKNRKKKKTTKQ